MHQLNRFLDRVETKSCDCGVGRPVVIVAFGDSVRMGATNLDVLEPDAVYHARVKRSLEARYPLCVFSVINAGVGGDSARRGLDRIKRDVLRYDPDLVFCHAYFD
ncbi:MAG: lysophospholipase [Phycisphaerales bacterium]|nr:lysophospholipase [Phycisphaerales bacterium]